MPLLLNFATVYRFWLTGAGVFLVAGRVTMKAEQRIAVLVSLWLQRPRDKRTSDDLTTFYRDLDRERPELLYRICDPYRQLRADLGAYILERKKSE